MLSDAELEAVRVVRRRGLALAVETVLRLDDPCAHARGELDDPRIEDARRWLNAALAAHDDKDGRAAWRGAHAELVPPNTKCRLAGCVR